MDNNNKNVDDYFRQWLQNSPINNNPLIPSSPSSHHPSVSSPYSIQNYIHLHQSLQDQISQQLSFEQSINNHNNNNQNHMMMNMNNNNSFTNDPWLPGPGLGSGSGSGLRQSHSPSPSPAHHMSLAELEKLRIFSAVMGQMPHSPNNTWGSGLGSGSGSGSMSGISMNSMMNNGANDHHCITRDFRPNHREQVFKFCGINNNGLDIDTMLRRLSLVNGNGNGNGNGLDRRQRSSSISRNFNNSINNTRARFDSDVHSNNTRLRTISQNSDDYGSWEDLRGKVADYAKDQIYCRKLQEMLEKLPRDGIKMMITEVKDDVKQIMNNQFGSHFFQNLLGFCDEADVTDLLRVVTATQKEFLEISVNVCGTRAVQKLLKMLSVENREQKDMMLSVLKGIVTTLSKDTGGHHVIQELVKVFQGSHDVIEPIVEEIAKNAVEIAMDKNGCCMLQQCATNIHGETRDCLLREIVSCAAQLSEHDYGNYVVQFIVANFNHRYTTSVILNLKGNFANLSKNKFGSHVVEKCLKESSDELFKFIIKEIVDHKLFLDVLLDNYGNYVIQTALTRAKEMPDSKFSSSAYKQLECGIHNHYVFLHSHPYGKRVLSHIKYCSRGLM